MPERVKEAWSVPKWFAVCKVMKKLYPFHGFCLRQALSLDLLLWGEVSILSGGIDAFTVHSSTQQTFPKALLYQSVCKLWGYKRKTKPRFIEPSDQRLPEYCVNYIPTWHEIGCTNNLWTKQKQYQNTKAIETQKSANPVLPWCLPHSSNPKSK